MVIKVFVSKQSGNKEIKKSQEHVVAILDSKKISYEEIDITDPGREEDKLWMWEHGTPKENQKRPLPPQIFNDDAYCGDYDAFHEAVEDETLDSFLKSDGSGDANGSEENGDKNGEQVEEQ